MKRSIILGCIVVTSLFAGTAKEMVLGKTYEIAEINIIELIQKHIADNKEEIEAKANAHRDKAKEAYINYRPKGLISLEPAQKDSVFYPDMTYTLDKDIVGLDGKVIYGKGYSFNPGDYITLSNGMIVINGENRREVEWFKNSEYNNSIAYMVLLSQGSYYDLNIELNQPVYYLTPEMRKKFQIAKTPSIITQIKNKIQVKEICLPCMSEAELENGGADEIKN